MERKKEAIKLLQEAWEKTLEPETGRLYAQKLSDSGKADEAIWIRNFIASSTKEPDDYFDLAMLLFINERYSEAIGYLDKAVEYENQYILEEFEDIEDYYTTGELWPYKKEPDEGKLSLYYLFKSVCFKKLEYEEKANQALEESNQYRYSEPYLYYKLAKLLINKKAYKESLKVIDLGIEAISNNEEDVERWLYSKKSEAYAGLEDENKQFATLNEAIQKFPTSIFPYLNLFHFLKDRNRFEEAYSVMENSLDAEIENPGPIIISAIIIYSFELINLSKLSFSDKAITKIEEHINEAELNQLFDFTSYFIEENAEFSRELINALIKKFPSNPSLHQFSAEYHFMTENMDKARKSLEKALELSDSDDQKYYIHNNLGYIDLIDWNFAQCKTTLFQNYAHVGRRS